nr:retrotransposon protein, putative, Ty1-copia subclass [Tanacetum cinerariifolium]
MFINTLHLAVPPWWGVIVYEGIIRITSVFGPWIKRSKEIAGLMLMTMEPDIQRNLETLHAYEMLLELKTLFAQQAEHELLQTTRDFYSCKQEEGRHWKKNYLQYLAELLKKKKNAASGAGGSGIFIIELNTILNRSRIYDTGCSTHICNKTQGLRASRKLKPRALSLYVGNGQRETIEAIGIFYLCLPSGFEIVLNNCHYASSITKGVIYVSRLYEDGFINHFVNNTIQVFRNNMVYFSSIPRAGIFEIDLSNCYTNESSIYAVSNKRAKLDLDSALLRHCRLGHISKKHIEKLKHDELLDSTDLRDFEKCVSCISGKMARKPYTHQVERGKDLLGLIHTDVCGPFKIMSRKGASYFVTFTDDFSRYGYAYLLKHKHEVFETFKVFQKEVENQLSKIIKSLCSDRGGEYMSQEFLDHLKDHAIIAHRTPPYTPQHNGVSKRRNRTLLDMVRSMMSQTTLPKSFWDYALETAACILNMVPTKKGCEALIKRDTLTKPEKLEPRSIKCIFIGYPKETMGYSFYYPPENKELVARNAEFLENSLITQEASESLEDLEIIKEEDTHPSIDTSLNHEEDDCKAYIILNKHTMKVEESLNVTFDESLPPTKLSPLVDDDVGEEEVIENNIKVPSLNGRGGPIAPIAIQATNFGLKNYMIQQVHNSCQFHGLPGDDANKHLDKFLHVTQSIKVNGVTDDTLHLYLLPYSLTYHATTWLDRLPRNSINTFEQMAKMFLRKYFPPSMVTKLINEITNFRQRPDISLFEAWEPYKLSIDRCPNHNMFLVTQIDTFYNGLTLRHRDTINAAAGETFMKRHPKECYDIIENMTAHHNDWDTSAQRNESSTSITSFSDTEIAALKAKMAEIKKIL